ncbi:MAG TPA: response regulator [Polyangiaceae bacterium]|jgi:CheY-like chemotaxis protein
MTTVLIVEDDPQQSRLLGRAISRRRPDYSVVCSANGREAIDVLEREDIDLVLTDLQMSEMNGFELLAWLLTHKPTVSVFTMTAYGNSETQARLASLGSVECFTKPIDVPGLLRKFSDCVAQSIRGQVKNLGLPSFLQLLEMEQKTCTLTVRFHDQSGTLFMRKGELLDARLGDQSGEEAATTIIGWVDPTITIEAGCSVTERAIKTRMGFVVMEAMRLRDESFRNIPVFDTDVGGRTIPARESTSPSAAAPPELPAAQEPAPPNDRVRRPGYVHAPVGAFVVAVVDAATGIVLACDGRERAGIGEAAARAAEVLRTAQRAVGPSANDESIQEFVVTMRSRCELIRPLPGDEGAFAFIAFDTSAMNLMIARLELNHAVATYLATATPRP